MNSSLLNTDYGVQSTLIDLSVGDQIAVVDEIEPCLPEKEKQEPFNNEHVSVKDTGYLFSIELKREQLRNEMASIFTFLNGVKEIDFISANEDVRIILPKIGEFFKKEISNGSMLNLELMEEENNWKTLFINVLVEKESDWEDANNILDSFYDEMFRSHSAVMEKLNIDLVTCEL